MRQISGPLVALHFRIRNTRFVSNDGFSPFVAFSLFPRMKWLCMLFLLVFAGNVLPGQDTADPVIGRWDITFDIGGITKPGWMEIERSGHSTLVGHIMIIGGSSRPVSQVHVSEGTYHFSIPRQWERGAHDLSFRFTYADDHLAGNMVFDDGNTYAWTANRAPALRKSSEPVWGEPIRLFNGVDLDGWTMQNARDRNQWIVEDGILKSPVSGANLRTEATFGDFKLHIEFRYPEYGNSGVYLRGRYEVQIADNKGMHSESHLFGGVYGAVRPSENVAKSSGVWQSFDITLVGRMITVVANGTTVICNQEIPGITGGALDSREGEPGPILLQGDHQPVEFRNIVLIPAAEIDR